jgi:hypothetical protein
MPRMSTLIVLFGLSAGALGGCYVVSPYGYPAYVPAYPPPRYPSPPPAGPPPPPASGATTAPSTGTPAPGAAAGPSDVPAGAKGSCETITVEGHWETHVRPGGQQERIWVPTGTIQVCR